MDDSLNKDITDSSDKELEVVLRPTQFSDFEGQGKIVENLKIFIQAARERNDALDHVLLHGPQIHSLPY